MVLHADFFLTLISACFQAALAVLSGILTVLYQDNFPNVISNDSNLNNQQQLILTVTILGFGGILPMMGILLY